MFQQSDEPHFGSPSRFHVPSTNDHSAVAAHFIGPKCENMDIMMNAINYIFHRQKEHRLSYHGEDPSFISEEMRSSKAFQDATEQMYNMISNLTELLTDHSVPFFSPRYSAHMCMENSMPAILGYIATMLYNPNNVAFEASPITTLLEITVGQQMCAMLGYKTDVQDDASFAPWGHIASGGSIANLESMCIRNAVDEGPFQFISDTFTVKTCQDEEKLFASLNTWELLNLKLSTILEIPQRLFKEYGISPVYFNKVMNGYSIQTVSTKALESKFQITAHPRYYVSSTKHYSWPKSAALCGIGSQNIINVPVDREARMNTLELRKLLEESYQNQTPVYAVVGVIGTTEEGAVDPLGEILDLRKEYERKGMSFLVHADAAWGGYFSSLIRQSPPGAYIPETRRRHAVDVPHVALRETIADELRNLQYADSITLDPHKSGYVPYPAGGLCYRDGRMRYALSWTAPYINTGSTDSIGTYGVEGSKPGASAAAVWMSHESLGLHQNGLGILLGEAAFTCRRFASFWTAMSTDEDSFIIKSLNLLPSEKEETPDPKMIEEERRFIRENILGKSNESIAANPATMKMLNQLGSDLNINAFACNFRLRDGTINTNVEEANYMNRLEDYGECVKHFKMRLGLHGPEDLFVMRNVVMSPFSTAHDYLDNLISIFKGILEEEVENVRHRNEIMADTHTFQMQGTDKLHLVYLPHFHKAAGRQQLIVSSRRIHLRSWISTKPSCRRNPGQVVFLRNKVPATIQDIIGQKSFDAVISYDGGVTFESDSFRVENIQVEILRELGSQAQSATYPSGFCPFYLYGTPTEAHIDHMLLRHPNAQLSAANVKLDVDPPVSLSGGRYNHILLLEGIHEESMQPFPTAKDRTSMKDRFFFSSGRKLKVSIHENIFSSSNKPIDLARLPLDNPLSRGTITLGHCVFVDSENLNYENMAEPVPFRYSGHKMNLESKEQWTMRISDRLGITPAGEVPQGTPSSHPPKPEANQAPTRSFGGGGGFGLSLPPLLGGSGRPPPPGGSQQDVGGSGFNVDWSLTLV
ncbi:PLP-dependent transferase [Gymnopus androsaceus JB14]|uniref:PLP-dependent transferase n=1 Tax=Gymnopus androsaceus JB14 TaxID=1447944 RepID=A0A6A4IAN2_9AGAR|nr:PLP-dependent transferase [Gymnopus androsaceus JB14]